VTDVKIIEGRIIKSGNRYYIAVDNEYRKFLIKNHGKKLKMLVVIEDDEA